MSYWTVKQDLDFSWAQVMTSFWQRYPNPNAQHVTSEDVLDRKIVDGKIITKRLIVKRGKLPSYAQKLAAGAREGMLLEESVLDLETNTLTTYTRNINMCNLMVVHEKCVYTATKRDNNTEFPATKGSHSEFPATKGYHSEGTSIERHVWSSSSVAGIGGMLGRFGVKQYQKNLDKTIQGYIHVLRTMYDPSFVPDSVKNSQIKGRQVSVIVWLLKKIHTKLKQIIFQPSLAKITYRPNPSV